MKVRELIQWLAAFEDQDAEVVVVEHSRGLGYYDQGGTVRTVPFDPQKHTTYHMQVVSKVGVSRTLLLGEINA